MHPDSIKYTMVNTPFGLYEWLVMPMGLWNSLAVHQRHIFSALHNIIGKIYHVYLDNIIIWSNSLAEHDANVRLVLEALCTANLYCSLKKSCLFATEVDFLGHHISSCGIEPDLKKIKCITNWPIPKSATDVCACHFSLGPKVGHGLIVVCLMVKD